jgi:hypothetical protein
MLHSFPELLLFETTVTRFIEMAREFRMIPIRERVDHH